MNHLKQFVIPFVGLSTGNHRFSFRVDDKFFSLFEEAEIRQANVNVELDLEKKERMLVLNFHFKGSIGVTCSRCLDEFDMPVDNEEEFFVKFGDEYRDEADNVSIIPEGVGHFDIAPLLYDYLHLMIPYRVVHPDDENGNTTCDRTVISCLEQLKVTGENGSVWDKLKDINLD
ncbi:MAG: DUF177 domain-containing protein [Lentimicrobium sp.]|nr:DUF177 domain-containing protein [Lentimicrobiaceae bacterium]MDY0025446.1 DUF177 domain-containing protein [Lentimicrobium sp.]